MDVLIGFDPGGASNGGSFGWCVCKNTTELPVTILANGLAAHAEGAVNRVTEWLDENNGVATGVGIDAPLYWTPTGNRTVETIVRRRMMQMGAPHAEGTVQHINSLRGACVVQGVICGLLLRKKFPRIALSESHPKAILWLSDLIPEDSSPGKIRVSDIESLRSDQQGKYSEHERDAALAALSAWAMCHQPAGWLDLKASEEHEVILPIGENIAYWMPA